MGMGETVGLLSAKAGLLCIECRDCGHRSSITAATLRRRRGVTARTPISALRLRCVRCGSLAANWLVPESVPEAVRFTAAAA
jgi:hypothetical protein